VLLYVMLAVAFLQVCIPLELLGDGALKNVIVGNCYVREGILIQLEEY
jgi:hypothetical protein